MRETCCQFGPARQLAGIITEPASPERRAVCVLVSAGLVPKFGPHRLYALLARRLACEGFLTLRFDLGGIGESPPQSARLTLRERTELEIEAAVSFLCEEYGAERVVLGGLCSGATDSLRHAESDPRVTAVVLIDPFSYDTLDSGWRYFLLRVAGRVLRIAGIYEPLVDVSVESSRTSPRPKLIDYKYMQHDESRRVLAALLERRVRAHFVYTGGMRQFFNHPSQLAAMFKGLDLRDLVTVDHFPRTGHTQILEEDREELIEAISRRLTAVAWPFAT